MSILSNVRYDVINVVYVQSRTATHGLPRTRWRIRETAGISLAASTNPHFWKRRVDAQLFFGVR